MSFTNKSIFSISEHDQKKFRQLVNAITHDLFLTAIHFLKNIKLSQVLFSDINIRFRKNRHHLTGIKNLKALLMKCIKHTCMNYMRNNLLTKSTFFDSIEKFSLFRNNNNKLITPGCGCCLNVIALRHV